MSAPSVLTPPLSPSKHTNRRLPRWQVVVLSLLIAALYFDVVVHLVRDWWDDPNFSHGFLVPLFCAFVIWSQRKRLETVPTRSSWSGLVVLFASLLLLVLGVFGAELFLSRVSLVFFLAGVIIYFCGWRYFRALLFPWACLFLMIPIPAIIFNQITLPLQLFASHLASSMVSLLGVPVLREGNVLHLPTATLEVAEACSGIRSLVSLITLAIMYGYFSEPTLSGRTIIALAAVPVAVVTNGVRVMGTAILGYYWDPQKADGFFHTFSGWVIFVLAMGLLFALHAGMGQFRPWKSKRACPPSAGGLP